MSKRSCLVVALCALLCLPVGLAWAEVEYELEGGKWVAATAPAEGSPQGELAMIRRQLERGANRQALNAAKRFLKRYVDQPAREEVMMLAGLAQMRRGLYFQAYEWFEKQLAEFPGGRYSARALDCEYAVAEAFLGGKKRVVAGVFRLSAKEEGLDILTRIAEHVPGSAMAEKALLRIGDYRYAAGDYADAAMAFDHYLEVFSRSKEAPAAMLKAANAAYASYYGPAYDDAPLIEAQQRFRRFSEVYPISARSANVPSLLTQIKDAQGAKAFETARFYQRTGRPEAAAFYYRQVTDRYPDSDWGQQAKAALVKLGGAPETAVSHAPQLAAPAQPAAEARREVVELEKLAPTSQEGGKKK
jgi:outer membrane assembly lipoprotein YfiO